MKEALADIRNKIKAGRYPNEAAVTQGIVQRILGLLNWPVYDPAIVYPEYSVGSRRVDIALCHPPRKPAIFIEIKQVGQGNAAAEQQLLEYAFYQGVPMAILIDGQEWHFFLPAEQGDFKERRVYMLDILERELDVVVDKLKRYLEYNSACSGDSLAAARSDYRNIRKEREIQKTIPEAWNKLVSDADELLIELISDQVESMCGYKPSPDTVLSFLAENIKDSSYPHITSDKPTIKKPVSQSPNRPQADSKGAFRGPGFIFEGRQYQARSGREIIYNVLNIFADNDPTFLERYASLPKHGRTRRYVAKRREDLNPARLDLVNDDHTHEFRSGWWVNINVSHRTIERILRLACDVAGLTFGKDLVVYLK